MKIKINFERANPTIEIFKKEIYQFGIISEKSPITLEEYTKYSVSFESIKQENNQIILELKLFPPIVNKTNDYTATYDLNDLLPDESFFIGLAYILTAYNRRDNYMTKAKEFLEKSIHDEIDSCLPYYDYY